MQSVANQISASLPTNTRCVGQRAIIQRHAFRGGAKIPVTHVRNNRVKSTVSPSSLRPSCVLANGDLADSSTTDTIEPKSKTRTSRQRFSNSVQALILGGGATDSMGPLTTRRAKPAIPFGGSYRLIDIILTNLIHSGLTQIFVLTQYNSHSLNAHVSAAYPLTHFQANNSSFVEVIAATQTPDSQEWSKGSADAVRRCLGDLPQNPLLEDQLKDWLVLSGEHLYRMDYSLMIEQHRSSNADITISCTPVAADDPSLYGVDGRGLGLVEINEHGDVLRFSEKPARAEQDKFAHVSRGSTHEKPFVASMGVYVFKKDVLKDLLKDDGSDDFGADILPKALKMGLKVQGYVFTDYWEDISSLRAFRNANLSLALPNPPFTLEDSKRPTFTLPRSVPPAKLVGTCNVENSLIADGCFVKDSTVTRSVLGVNTTVAANCLIEDSLIMGHDAMLESVRISGAIGEGTVIKNAIVDKNVTIGPNCQIINAHDVQEGGSEEEGWMIRSGIVTVMRDAVIPSGTTI
mmetsp:Transcript_31667/g.38247  ORF Transcript_31667/g.38247 Transcript_31667/m.38247 type:complete len:518 (-) Transcript_31667:519-2072(-)|eukprot:CAMPEP_0197847388 /NCGR_PEP_ID=MMETSP1438-20131217/5868_1 /TAXON_ID=1461541 /ORGANISM="Pterosperma sp., Strain CCMP1384" /LENGTH=517 /DNA_ID=CAMNT_0043459287 /DNA_START=189 /DNA_END=1742 /DNA_ORIENTATION=+